MDSKDQYLTSRELASSVFKYILPNSPDIKGAAICPKTLLYYCELQYITPAETLTLWFYVRLLASKNSVQEPKLQGLCSAMAISAKYDKACVAHLTNNPIYNDVLTTQVLTNLPVDIVNDITSFLIKYTEEHLTERKELHGLKSKAFQHPDDRRFMNKLSAIPGFGKIVSKFTDAYKRFDELRLLSNSIEVNEHSLPSIYAVYCEACHRLDIKDRPPLYVESGALNAYTAGVDKPIVVVTSVMISLLSKEELMFVFGHELGHVIHGHVKYLTMARVLTGTATASAAVTIPILAPLVRMASKMTLGQTLSLWSRRAEYSADRTALLCCQNQQAAYRVMIKLAGYPPRNYRNLCTRGFIIQALKTQSLVVNSTMDRLHNLKLKFGATHPFNTERVLHLMEWSAEGHYSNFLSASTEVWKKIASNIEEDPTLHALYTKVTSVLIQWASGEFNVTRASAGNAIQKMIFEKKEPNLVGFNKILRIEFHVTSLSSSTVKYEVILLVLNQSKARKIVINVPVEDNSRTALPKQIRRDMLENNKDSHCQLLYTL